MTKQEFLKKLKFYLGLPCVVRYGDLGWVVTYRGFPMGRRCLAVSGSHVWFSYREYIRKSCVFKTQEGAEKALADYKQWKREIAHPPKYIP
ncbi:hypothetical protein D3C78_779630 [compost metagenome]